MNNAHVHPLFVEILSNAAAVATPSLVVDASVGRRLASLTRQCPACWASDNGSSGCVQCAGRGRIATNGGEA